MCAATIPLALTAETSCASGGGSSLRKDDGDKHTTILKKADKRLYDLLENVKAFNRVADLDLITLVF
jgi:hypothetical protein